MSALAKPTQNQWLHVVKEQPKLRLLTEPKLTPYIPHRPHPPQAAFLLLNHIREVMFGGAAGGGKSDAMLMAALQYVDVPGYSALLLRRTTTDHKLPGSIMDRAQMWLSGTDAKWRDRDRTFIFPSGAKIVFGFLEHENDKYRYSGAEFQFIGFDELTQFSETMYTFMFSRLRRLKSSRVPIRMRSATNPIGEGADWVRNRWGIGARKSQEQQARIFIPSRISDNPSLDREEYEESLNELDPVTKAQLLDGNWEIRPNGGKFRRENFKIIDITGEKKYKKIVRYWDLASSDPRSGEDPDWTVGTKMGLDHDNRVTTLDIRRFRKAPGEVEKEVRKAALEDGRNVRVGMGQDPGQAGVAQIDNYSRFVLPEFHFTGFRESGEKAMRGDILSAKSARGEVLLLRAPWNKEFLDEAEIFPLGTHDDQIDSAEGARKMLFLEIEDQMRTLSAPGFGKTAAALTNRQIRQQLKGSRTAKRRRAPALPRRTG